MAHGNCMQTAANHEASVNARNEELAVIAKAKQILVDSSSGAVAHSYSLLQVRAASQIRSRADLTNAEVATKVKKLAQEYHSAALAQLASKVAAVARFGARAGEDPFAKIKGLISDMIAKLEAEALAEANEKAYCDEQMSKTKTKKEELEYDMSKLTSKIDTAAAKSAGLKADVKELQAELAALAKLQAEMDQVRQDTHAAYVAASTDLKQGLTGVRKALGVLRDYYGGAAAGAALMQESMPAVTFHSKAGGAGTSIIGILEVCESDFAKGLAAEETEEADAQSEYETTTQKNKVTRTMKEQDVKYKTQSFNGLDKEIAELSSDRAATGTELDAVNEYYGKIKDRCIAKPETYEERKRRREAEIAGLKEALATLENETALVQRSRRGLRKHFLGA